MTEQFHCSAGSARAALAGLYPLMDSLEAFRGDKDVLRISGKVGDAQDVGIAGVENTRLAIAEAVKVLEGVRDAAQGAFESARDYVDRAIASYVGDPADNQFQKGFLAALEVVRDEAFAAQPPAAPVEKLECEMCAGSKWKSACPECDGTGYYTPDPEPAHSSAGSGDAPGGYGTDRRTYRECERQRSDVDQRLVRPHSAALRVRRRHRQCQFNVDARRRRRSDHDQCQQHQAERQRQYPDSGDRHP